MNFFYYTSSAATPFYEELARLTGGHYLKLGELEHIVDLMECVMHRARSVEHGAPNMNKTFMGCS